MRCPGLHCDGCGRGGGGAALLVLVLVVIIAAARRPLEHAARVGLDVLEVAAIAVTSLAVLAVFGGVAYVAVRARRSRANGITRVSFPAPAGQRSSEALSAPRRRAIEAPRPSLADLQDLAARHGYDLTRRQAQDDD